MKKWLDLQFDELRRQMKQDNIISEEQERLNSLIADIARQKKFMVDDKLAFERQQSARRRAVIRASQKLRLGTLNKAQKHSRYRRRLRTGQQRHLTS
ncbi:hypothetical protein SCHPADRAFT_910981 [Schizopora paradoxa]|uniref:Uncharacterized protein n=1 Tax=Schizopora paradoxa TaxID=27342 RepID=A0A0H2R1D5_9AGAM|nr:hypothetical protein SCHPADRAFT_910981 [Schizopora paradoxa]